MPPCPREATPEPMEILPLLPPMAVPELNVILPLLPASDPLVPLYNKLPPVKAELAPE